MTDVLGQVDIAFVVDRTGSMGPFIQEAREQCQAVLDKAEADGDLDIRVALVGYRDHPPQDLTFVVQTEGFGDTAALRRQLLAANVGGGGDTPEAVLDGLLAAATLDWRSNADKTIYLVGDAPAHGLGSLGDGFPLGCPCRATPGGVVEVINASGIRVNVISIGTDVLGFKDFSDACHGSYTQVSPAHMEMSTTFMAAGVAGTSSLVGHARAYTAMSASLGSSDPTAVSAALGWSTEMGRGTLSYMSSRGIDPTPETVAKDGEVTK